jgi:F-type H+-transporting ATPase subunit delta
MVSNGNVSQTLGYARAIYQLALESWQKALMAVQEQLAADPDLLAELDDIQASFEARQKKLNAILPADMPDQTRNLFYTLLKAGDLHLLEDIAVNLVRLATKGSEVQLATVTSAIPLVEAEKERFRVRLAAKYGDNLVFEFKVDQQLIGGVVVQVGDKILDGSIATKLNSIRESLMTG